MATIRDIAKAANVSVATVSRVANSGPKVGAETRARVLHLMSEMGYRPNANARALVTRKSVSIGLVVAQLDDPFFASLAAGVDRIARRHNRQLLLSTGMVEAETEREALELLLERRCESIVLHSKSIPDDDLVAYARATPGLVLINRNVEAISERCVWLDNNAGGAIAANYLADMGHHRLACITSEYHIEDPLQRMRGFANALESRGLELPAAMIEYGEPNQEGGEAAVRNLLAKGCSFSALFAYNDSMASGAISTLIDNGLRVPEDVSVIGFDDVLLARYQRPKLTTLRYPIDLMAASAAELAVQLAQGEAAQEISPRKYLPSLVKRQTVCHR